MRDDVARGFDRAAADYAATWGANPLAHLLRARVIARGVGRFPRGARLVDLGCGPGLDARVLCALGHSVLGVDGSAGMVRAARAAGIDAVQADLRDVAALRVALRPADACTGPPRRPEPATARFDGAISNFGALNCLPDLRPLAGVLAERLAPGAFFLAVVMGPRCVAEDVALIARGRRPRRRDGPVTVEGEDVPVRFLSWRTVARELGHAFRVVDVEALGVLVPPPDLGGAPGRRTRIEPHVARLPLLRDSGDHTLITLCRT